MQIIGFLLLSQFIPPNQTLAPIHTKSAGALAKPCKEETVSLAAEISGERYWASEVRLLGRFGRLPTKSDIEQFLQQIFIGIAVLFR